MENNKLVKFSFLLSGGEQITRVVELKGVDEAAFLTLRRYDDRYVIQIGPHTIDLPADLMKEVVEDILLTYPDENGLQEIIKTLSQDKPWLFERLLE